MQTFIKTLEVTVIEHRFDCAAWDYERNVSGCWLPFRRTMKMAYDEAIRYMRVTKKCLANGMSSAIVDKIVSVRSIFTYRVERTNRHPNPNLNRKCAALFPDDELVF